MLNVSSTTTLPWSDLKTSARIVAAAFQRFAQSGFTSVTIREIAGEAGVSAALVIHYFGSKDGLRRECDSRVVKFVRDKLRTGAPAAENLQAWLRFDVATSLGFDIPRAVLTVALVVVAGRVVLVALRRAT
ncbi:MAG TPA: helix-turn-helix domain-containing protein, partial [Micropruina sp.]|nr:helix-turn-helix domain-containing protein [Micropruina sp.]